MTTTSTTTTAMTRTVRPRRAGAGMDDLRANGDTMVPAGAIDLAVNVHGAAPAPHVRAAVIAALDQAAAYPEHSRAVAAIAARHARDHASVLVTAGAAEAF